MTLPIELTDRLEKLPPDQLKKFVQLLEQQQKQNEIEYEYLKRQSALREVPSRSSSPEGEIVGNLDNASFIDMNTRLTDDEISASMRFDVLQRMGIMPQNVPLTDIFKRLKVSQKGQGRQEKVSIITGSRQQRMGSGFMDNLFKKRKSEEELIARPQIGQ